MYKTSPSVALKFKLVAVLVSAALLSFSRAYGHDDGNVANVSNRPAIGDPATSISSSEKPGQIEGVGISEKLGTQLDLSLTFKDEAGKPVQLSQFVNGKVPVIISPVYFSCPGLCNFHLNGLTEALKEVDWSAGQQYQVLAISFDAKEGPELAAQKKVNYMKVYDRPGTEQGWHFLTGDAEAVKKLTDMLGFKYRWNEETKEWAHASAAIVSSPNGKITRYLPGIQFIGKDVKLALTEGGEGKVGTFVDQLVLYCFQYNPHQSKYSLYVLNIMKLGGAIMVLLMAIWLVPVFWRSKRQRNG